MAQWFFTLPKMQLPIRQILPNLGIRDAGRQSPSCFPGRHNPFAAIHTAAKDIQKRYTGSEEHAV